VAGLRATGLKVHYGGVKAIDGVDIEVAPGEIVGLIGPNGAGKSTLINALTNVVQRTSGELSIDGVDVTGHSTARLVQDGLVRTFQSPRLFGRLSVFENIVVACLGRGQSRKVARRTADEILERISLTELKERDAASLSYGQERIASIGRALASSPRYLLLDEPAAGLNESETDNLMASIRAIRDDFGCAITVVEHNMRLIMQMCERIQVLDHGQTLIVGSPEEARADPRVIEAYLGV